eukprot:CAMPEP_0202870774 /NCGR_PEP_ID=MMETSP1391-20130828/16745_1 /ASSEMBLY_ACC=CAM_ASM_000867 /TAXON_ID=1034604 /ORGANISM="Chlamydomonas leiostraca, Strain SAG 11-49" /LENGTH=43 /DNA_ID= /DNA_START= /DNA_END= /DNA_ORIENTATION=
MTGPLAVAAAAAKGIRAASLAGPPPPFVGGRAGNVMASGCAMG